MNCYKCGATEDLIIFNRVKNPSGKRYVHYICRACNRAKWKKSMQSAEFRKKKADYNKRYNELHPERARAWSQAYRANKGSKKPCQECGAFIDIHKHHPDYTKPKLVVFLCGKHHKIAHGHGSII